MADKAIILDRDGVINRDFGYTYEKEKLEFLPGVISGLKKFSRLGYKLIIITNQSGVGRGYHSLEQMHQFHDHLLSLLEAKGITIDKIYYCPHKPDDGCDCRKPKSKLGQDAIDDFNIDVERSYYVGDKDSDITFGQNIGLKTVMIKDSQYKPKLKADFEINSLEDLIHII